MQSDYSWGGGVSLYNLFLCFRFHSILRYLLASLFAIGICVCTDVHKTKFIWTLIPDNWRWETNFWKLLITSTVYHSNHLSATNDNKRSIGQSSSLIVCFKRGLKNKIFHSRIYGNFPPAMATVDDISSVARSCDRLENEIEVTAGCWHSLIVFDSMMQKFRERTLSYSPSSLTM